MDLSSDRYKAMTFTGPDRIPISCGILPSAWIRHRDALQEIVSDFPEIFGSHIRHHDYDEVNGTYVAGKHVDVWGCVWENVHHGQEAIVTGHPVPERKMVHELEIPTQDAGLPHGFMYLRLQDLRGFEELMVDFAEEPPELQILIDKVLAYNLRQVRLRIDSLDEPESLVYFGDDLGMQRSLPMSPAAWRKYLKPCFAAIYAPVREAGHHVYMHTDGHILPIIGDLIDCGVEVVNPQFRANGLEGLVREAKGRICMNLDLDRQLFPFATPEQIDEHVHEAVETLGSPAGGLWLAAEIDDGVPLPNVRAVLEALRRYSTYFSASA
jgi:hypothetical protein